MTSVNSYFFKSTQSNSENSIQKSSSSIEQMHLRLCLNCGLILEKKYNIQKDKIIRPEFANLYDVNFEFLKKKSNKFFNFPGSSLSHNGKSASLSHLC